MKSRIAKLTCLLLFTALAMPVASFASEKKMKLVLTSEAGDRESPLGKAMQAWAAEIENKTDKRIRVNVFYQGELGGQQELFDQLVKGNVHMMITWPQTSYDERIGVNYIPYLVLGWDDAIRSYGKDGWLREVVEPVYDDMGLKYFGPFPEGFGGIATKGRYATNEAAAKGLKVRSQPIFPLPQTVNAMGFQAVPIDWSEVYTSIQTGVVDGDSSNVIYWDYEYFRDQLDYFVHSQHNFSSYALLMNGNTWSDMDEEDRKIVSEAAQNVIDKQFRDAKQEDEKWIAKAQESGMEYIVPSNADMNAWIKKVRSTVWPQAEEKLGKSIMDQIRSNATQPE